MNKKELGKFYTINNPFKLKIFQKWFNSIPNINNLEILEPFAGSNNIVNLVNCNNIWKCYDIQPTKNNAPKFNIIKQDTIKNFPKGFNIVITNPPYLAKNTATRKHLYYQGGEYDDLYKKCLEIMLNNCKYIAAIIPESFITANIFHNRLEYVISLTCKMFDDTYCPVCLALFSENISDDFIIYNMDNYIGKYSDLLKFKPINTGKYKFIINDPNGNIGLIGIDNNKGNNIHFVDGNTIDSKLIKNTTRTFTRLTCSAKINNYQLFYQKCNEFIEEYRKNTNDIFLTSFKNLRDDGKYRRRLDFNTAKSIIEYILINNPNI